jgi:hypothetical protein
MEIPLHEYQRETICVLVRFLSASRDYRSQPSEAQRLARAESSGALSSCSGDVAGSVGEISQSWDVLSLPRQNASIRGRKVTQRGAMLIAAVMGKTAAFSRETSLAQNQTALADLYVGLAFGVTLAESSGSE